MIRVIKKIDGLAYPIHLSRFPPSGKLIIFGRVSHEDGGRGYGSIYYNFPDRPTLTVVDVGYKNKKKLLWHRSAGIPVEIDSEIRWETQAELAERVLIEPTIRENSRVDVFGTDFDIIRVRKMPCGCDYKAEQRIVEQIFAFYSAAIIRNMALRDITPYREMRRDLSLMHDKFDRLNGDDDPTAKGNLEMDIFHANLRYLDAIFSV